MKKRFCSLLLCLCMLLTLLPEAEAVSGEAERMPQADGPRILMQVAFPTGDGWRIEESLGYTEFDPSQIRISQGYGGVLYYGDVGSYVPVTRVAAAGGRVAIRSEPVVNEPVLRYWSIEGKEAGSETLYFFGESGLLCEMDIEVKAPERGFFTSLTPSEASYCGDTFVYDEENRTVYYLVNNPYDYIPADGTVTVTLGGENVTVKMVPTGETVRLPGQTEPQMRYAYAFQVNEEVALDFVLYCIYETADGTGEHLTNSVALFCSRKKALLYQEMTLDNGLWTPCEPGVFYPVQQLENMRAGEEIDLRFYRGTVQAHTPIDAADISVIFPADEAGALTEQRDSVGNVCLHFAPKKFGPYGLRFGEERIGFAVGEAEEFSMDAEAARMEDGIFATAEVNSRANLAFAAYDANGKMLEFRHIKAEKAGAYSVTLREADNVQVFATSSQNVPLAEKQVLLEAQKTCDFIP